MRSAGNVLYADIFVGSDGRSKGLGTVEFSKPYEVRISSTHDGMHFFVYGTHVSSSAQELFPLCCTQASNAINQMNDSDLMGRPILVREYISDGRNFGREVGGGAGARVFVGNLAWKVQWQDLKDYMRQVCYRL